MKLQNPFKWRIMSRRNCTAHVLSRHLSTSQECSGNRPALTKVDWVFCPTVENTSCVHSRGVINTTLA